MFSRAFISLGRAIRVAQMLHLHQLDGGNTGSSMMPRAVPPSRDWIELEERRRTWWVIYVSDRLVSATSGLPAAIDDRQVGGALLKSFRSGFFESSQRHRCAHCSLRPKRLSRAGEKSALVPYRRHCGAGRRCARLWRPGS